MGCLNHENHLNGQIFFKPFQKSCFRADCEKCCFKWLGRSASKSTKRMKLYEKQSKKIITLPINQQLSENEMEHITTTMNKYFEV